MTPAPLTDQQKAEEPGENFSPGSSAFKTDLSDRLWAIDQESPGRWLHP